MKICGIICEYNPFHNGHLYHIQQAKLISRCDLLICVMSGNVVQRGEFSICDKWQRANAAIKAGADLVLELPYPYVVQSADRFAKGAVKILNLAQVDTIVFGSESNDLSHIEQLLKTFKENKLMQNNTISSAKQLELLLNHKLSSNDILALFYINEATKYHMNYQSILRTNSYHDLSLHNSIASATAIRCAYYKQQDISAYTPMNPIQFYAYSMEHYYPYLQVLIQTTPASYLSTLFMVDEGIEHLFKKNINAPSYTEFINLCTSKRYTKTRIQRTIMHILTQTAKSEIDKLPPLNYIRILAFNEKGQSHLKHLKNTDVQVASRFNQIPKPFREIEYRVAQTLSFPFSQTEKQQILSNELTLPKGASKQ